MRSAAVTALAVAGAIATATAIATVSCGSTDLQPIHESGSAVIGGAVDGGRADAAAPDDAAGTPERGRCKRGIAQNAAPSAAFLPSPSSPGISWWYNYSNQPAAGGAPIEFVPMIWGGGSLRQSIPENANYLLGFNEPNFTTEANLTTQQAASDWPVLESLAAPLGIPIVSPGVNFCGSASDSSQCTEPVVTDPYTYLKDFFAACPSCKVDSIAVHWYNCDVPSLRAYLEGNGDGGLEGFVQFGKPIWLTEFSCDSSHSVEDQEAYMQAAVPYLENNPNVMRYAWFSAAPIPSAELANKDGSLTDLGGIYVGLAQNCP